MHQQSDAMECRPDRLTCSCSPELVRGLLGFVQKIPASSCQRNFTVDLRDEGVAAGGDWPHRVFLTLILHDLATFQILSGGAAHLEI